MKTLTLIITVLLFSLGSFAQVNPNSTYVNGYTKKNGTHVKGHYRTKPNHTNRDNYSTKPNVNPYTGKKGYVKPDNNYSTPRRTNNYYSAPKRTTNYSNNYRYSSPSRGIRTYRR